MAMTRREQLLKQVKEHAEKMRKFQQEFHKNMSNKDEIKRLTEQLTSKRMLDFFKENFNYKIKKVTYDEYIKEVYSS